MKWRRGILSRKRASLHLGLVFSLANILYDRRAARSLFIWQSIKARLYVTWLAYLTQGNLLINEPAPRNITTVAAS